MKLARIATAATAGIGLVSLGLNSASAATATANGGTAANNFFNSSDTLNTSEIAGTTNSLTTVIQNITNYLTGFVTLIAVLYGIYGGYLYLTAGGEEEQTKKAKTIFKQVAIGILIIFVAYSVVSFFMGILGSDNSTASNIGTK